MWYNSIYTKTLKSREKKEDLYTTTARYVYTHNYVV